MSDDRLRRAYAEELKQNYLKTGFKQGFEAGYAKAKEDFEKTIEIPRGKWIEGFDGHFETLNCNKCGCSKPSTHYEFNFCPNCGAPMTDKAMEIIRKKEGEQSDRETSKDS